MEIDDPWVGPMLNISLQLPSHTCIPISGNVWTGTVILEGFKNITCLEPDCWLLGSILVINPGPGIKIVSDYDPSLVMITPGCLGNAYKSFAYECVSPVSETYIDV